MARMATRDPASLPNLVVAQRVLERMARAAQAWRVEETGEALVGLVEPGLNTNGVPGVYLLDTIAPDDSALRAAHTFQQGDPHQDDLLWWLQENWDARRRRGDLEPKWDVPLRYLGDWHKQPGGMTWPSGGDLHTAREWLRDPENGMDFLLAPIVTRSALTVGAERNRLRIDAQTCVDFWYLQREARKFSDIAPVVYQDEQLPSLSPAPWHLQEPQRLEAEFDRLLEAGFTTSPLVFLDLLEQSDLDICFMLARPGAARMMLVATPPDYPAHPPQLRCAASVAVEDDSQMHERFLHCWQEATPLCAPEAPADNLAALIGRLERENDLQTATAGQP